MRFIKSFFDFLKVNYNLVIALLASAPLYLLNALKYSAPMGYAGLFTQMAQQVADANFLLPITSPFYGPGGVPFAYPPFGLYLLAIFIKLTGKYYIFLRILPPLISLLAFIPLYYVALQLSGSKSAAFLAVLIVASSVNIYVAHAWAAGIVRAPAFLFSLAAIYFFLRQVKHESSKDTLLTGVFWGLTILSHFVYALFVFVWIGWWSFFGHKVRKNIKNMIIIYLIGFLIASPWLITISVRYGMTLFVNAFSTHGGQSILTSVFISPLRTFLSNLSPVWSNPLFLVLVILGITGLLAKRNYIFLSLYLLIVLAFPENIRFTFLLSAIVGGIGFSFLQDLLTKHNKLFRRPYFTVLLLIFFMGYFQIKSFMDISSQTPLFDGDTLELADSVQKTTSPDAVYLALFRQDEAEWLPFIFQREPLVAQWGSEWIGTYNKQANLMSLFRTCQKDINWTCVQTQFDAMQRTPDLLVTYTLDRKLNKKISIDQNWLEIYANKRYILWQFVKTVPQK